MARPHIDQVRKALMATLDELRNPESTPDLDKARAIAQVAGVLIESAKVEVEYLKVTSQQNCAFLGEPELIAEATPKASHNGVSKTAHGSKIVVNGVTQHRMAG